MKKIAAIFIAVLMLVSAVIPTAFANEPVADNTTGIEGEVNYAFKTKYTLQKNGTEITETNYTQAFLGGKEDKDFTLLTDGIYGYEETSGVSVVFIGATAKYTVIFDLGAIKSDIKKIRFKNVRDTYSLVQSGVLESGNRGFDAEATVFNRSVYGNLPIEDYATILPEEITIEKAPNSTDPEAELETAEYIDITYTFEPITFGRYIAITFSSSSYCKCFDEIQIIGYGDEDLDPGEFGIESSEAPSEEPSEESSEDTDNNISFEWVDGTLTVSGNGDMPDYTDGAPWESYKQRISKLIVKSGITSIGNCAFRYVYNLSSIELPDGITSIGDHAFEECRFFESVEIPSSVKSIGDYAFFGCSKLTEITVPESVTSIGAYAFASCHSLREITLFDTVTSIGEYAFYNCDFINIDIPKKLTVIPNGLFSGCYRLISVEIPSGVTSIGDSAFASCRSLGGITIPGKVTSIGSHAFHNCEGIQEITVPNGVTSIGAKAFYGCSGLKTITLPDSVTSIGEYAFYSCKYLTDVKVPGGVKNIANNIFERCYSLATVELPSGLTSIGEYAFYDCSALKNINIPGGVTEIGRAAFGVCASLESITIPKGITSIENYTFTSCGSLTEITIPSGVTNIGYQAFKKCNNLISVTFEKTGVWCVYKSGEEIYKKSVIVKDKSEAAECLKNTYSGYYWYRKAPLENYPKTVVDYANGLCFVADSEYMTAEAVLALFAENSQVFSYDKEWNYVELTGDDKICTGSFVLENGFDYTIIISGDMDRSGTVDSTDLILLKRYLIGTHFFDGACLTAADIDMNGVVDSTDWILTKRSLLNTIDIFAYTQNKLEEIYGFN